MRLGDFVPEPLLSNLIEDKFQPIKGLQEKLQQKTGGECLIYLIADVRLKQNWG